MNYIIHSKTQRSSNKKNSIYLNKQKLLNLYLKTLDVLESSCNDLYLMCKIRICTFELEFYSISFLRFKDKLNFELSNCYFDFNV